MKDRNLEKQLDNAVDAMLDMVYILTRKIEELEQDIEDLEKKHEQALNEAYKRGYNDALNAVESIVDKAAENNRNEP